MPYPPLAWLHRPLHLLAFSPNLGQLSMGDSCFVAATPKRCRWPMVVAIHACCRCNTAPSKNWPVILIGTLPQSYQGRLGWFMHSLGPNDAASQTHVWYHQRVCMLKFFHAGSAVWSMHASGIFGMNDDTQFLLHVMQVPHSALLFRRKLQGLSIVLVKFAHCH